MICTYKLLVYITINKFTELHGIHFNLLLIPFSLLIFILFSLTCIFMRVCACMCGCLRRTEKSIWALGTELWFSVSALQTFNY